MKLEPATGPLTGVARVPGDKSIGHRALMLAAVADGTSIVRGLSSGEDVRSTLRCVEAVGAEVTRGASGGLRIGGRGLGGLCAPGKTLDCGNSGTTVRLMAGMLAGRGFSVRFDGDESLRRRPMGRIAEPLRRMGAVVEGRSVEGRLCLPLVVGGGPLHGIEHRSEVASAQVKSCLLFAGLRAEGRTTVIEPARSRDHTERMLRALGVPVEVEGLKVAIDGPVAALDPFELEIPGDPSSAAFLVVATTLVPGSALRIEGVSANPTRTAFIDVLRRMGAELDEERVGDRAGEPVMNLVARSAPGLRGVEVGGEIVPRLIDEVPILAVAAAFAEGVTVFHDVGELRVKESDRLASTCALLSAFGVACEAGQDTLTVHGRGLSPLEPRAVVETQGDHRIALAATVLALRARRPVEARGIEAERVSFPGLRALLAERMRR